MTPQIVVLDDWEHAFERLADWAPVRDRAEVVIHHEPLKGGRLLAATEAADVLVLMRDRTPLDAALIAQLPRLKHVIHTGTVNRLLDAQALAARGIAVETTQWGPSTASTCEHAWALILAAMRQLPRDTALLRDGRWRWDDGEPAASVLHGERIGLAGLGQIGSLVARVALAFGMEVVTWSPHMTPERAAQHGAASVTLEELLSTSRVVSLHLVPSPATHHLMNAERIGWMRRDALLVNTSRASLVDMDALTQALRSGRLGAAAVDVFDEEPLPADHPLRNTPNLIATPHTGFVAEPVLATFATQVVERLAHWLEQSQQ